MDFTKLIKFEPINLAHIVVTIVIFLVVIFAFKTQLNSFVDGLKDRPITVKMSSSETSIKLGVPVNPSLLAESITNPSGTQEQLNNWAQNISDVNNIDDLRKHGFNELLSELASLESGKLAVLNFTVNDNEINYFQDKSMLRYLSIASEKVKYLAFYEEEKFVGALKIESVISGLASLNDKFVNFGNHIKNGEWENLPGLITKASSFTHTPTIKELHEYLSRNEVSEVPLLKNNELVGILNYESISSELYAQATSK